MSRLARILGVGQGIADFDAYMATSTDFQASWNSIQNQLFAEGSQAGDIYITAAKGALANAFGQLSSGFGVDPKNALDAATNYVMLGQTAIGAVTTAQQLVQTQGMSALPQLAAVFTGTMIGVGVAVGAVSAGVGAGIVFGVDALAGILSSPEVGLFGKPPPGVTICPGTNCNPNPDFVVGCLCGWNDPPGSGGVAQIVPKSPLWRSFPNPITVSATSSALFYIPVLSTSDIEDAPWFQSGSPSNLQFGPWKGADFGYSLTANPAGPTRPIDVAFYQYSSIEQLSRSDAIAYVQSVINSGNVPPSILWQPGGPLTLTFVTGWKSNAEYALNGLKTQPDWQVLAHAIRLWNRSHDGPTSVMTYDASMYHTSLVTDAVKGLGNDPLVDPSGMGLVVNVGPVKNVPQVSPLSATFNLPVIPTVLGIASLGIVGYLSAYAYLHHTTVTSSAQHFWQDILGLFRRHAKENPEGPRRVAFRVHLDSHNVVILRPDNTAILYKFGQPIADFNPAHYQLTKIRAGRGDILIYTDQLIGV